MRKSEREEVVFVGADGLERRAWIAKVLEDGPQPSIDVTFTPPGSTPTRPEDGALPAVPPTASDDATDPKFHPSLPETKDTYAVAHESVARPNMPFWRESAAAMEAQVRMEMPGRSESDIQAEIARRTKAAKDAREAAAKAAKEAAAKAAKEAAAKGKTVPMTAPSHQVDHNSPGYIAGAKAKADGKPRDATKNSDWLDGYDGK